MVPAGTGADMAAVTAWDGAARKDGTAGGIAKPPKRTVAPPRRGHWVANGFRRCLLFQICHLHLLAGRLVHHRCQSNTGPAQLQRNCAFANNKLCGEPRTITPRRRLPNTMDVSFCTAALEGARARFGKPESFNTAQGNEFTSATSPVRSNEPACRFLIEAAMTRAPCFVNAASDR
jgi:hypothetical protein